MFKKTLTTAALVCLLQLPAAADDPASSFNAELLVAVQSLSAKIDALSASIHSQRSLPMPVTLADCGPVVQSAPVVTSFEACPQMISTPVPSSFGQAYHSYPIVDVDNDQANDAGPPRYVMRVITINNKPTVVMDPEPRAGIPMRLLNRFFSSARAAAE